jgi:hypothetical protein
MNGSPHRTEPERRICLPGNPACPPPDVTITPGSGTFSTASQTITIEWCGHEKVISRQVVLNGVDVTSAFSFITATKAGCSWYRTSTGTITLVTGTNSIDATAIDAIDQEGSSSASYTLAPPSPPQLSISSSGPTTVEQNHSDSVTFVVQNTGSVPVTASITATCNAPVVSSPCTPSSGSVSLGGGTGTTVVVRFQSGTAFGTGSVVLTATNTTGPETWSNSRAVAVVPPPPDISAAGNPGDVRDPSRCVLDCFEKVFTYSTPGYVSRDVEHGVTLVYRSGEVHPVSTVVIHVGYLPVTPLKVSLKLKKPDGSLETFLNGRDEIFFEPSPNSVPPLVGQFSAGSGPTRRVAYTAIVTSYYPDTTAVATVPAPVLIVNEENSPFGAGVTAAGVQRLYVNPDGAGVVITDGSGGATYFGGSCQVTTACAYSTPVGDFTTLTTTGDGSYYRRYPDGTVVRFTGGGYHSATTDRFGNVTQYGYTWNADYNLYALYSVIDPAGQAITLWYRDVNSVYGGYYKVGSLGSVTHNGGRTASFGIDPSNNLLHWVDTDGTYYAVAAYDGAHRMTQVQDQNNGIWNFAYAMDGSLGSRSAPPPTSPAHGCPSPPPCKRRPPRLSPRLSSGAAPSPTPAATRPGIWSTASGRPST